MPEYSPKPITPSMSYSHRDEELLIDPRYVKDYILTWTYNDHPGTNNQDRKISTSEKSSPAPLPQKAEHAPRYQVLQVFKKSGIPDVTYVEREDFGSLKLALGEPGRGVIIEGPSGVGKTTALNKAIAEIGMSVHILSARNPKDLSRLETLWDWHDGTVIIDDFHRLDSSLCKRIADYLKFLADTLDDVEAKGQPKKLVIVGIPQTGQTLVDISLDLARRIEVFKLGQVSEELVLNMIEKGEKALNIQFDRKGEIALVAKGSLNLAQSLCLAICQRHNVLETQDHLHRVSCDIDAAVSSVMVALSRQFGTCIEHFAAMGGTRDRTSLELLEALAHSDDGFISFPILKEIKPELARGIERFISQRWMDNLYHEYPEAKKYLFFAPIGQRLVIDDPQLSFYLKRIDLSALAKRVGKVATHKRNKVFIGYSHKDARWLERIQVHLRPMERESRLELWDDTKIVPGQMWKEEILAALESAIVAVILVSADFLASDFIFDDQLPILLSQARTGGTTILSILVSSCSFEDTGLEMFQMVNARQEPLNLLEEGKQEQILDKLVRAIKRQLIDGEDN